ncbi:hypothetical protein Aros01_05103 [Streptosporangium roseum]|uniref:Uncharacterized protein n=1 Tax=Streptosporangium roseum (strain ATCC 12428 / DSM 43021 / JCM 3005 / KCTC 9067 / NCIMB 10171 / NRRL 2505 / NI 9100) TaxID=479432 RepID=D2BAP2_STRRD|nr:hypothetical protein Sros_7178 [Streptosporangium roseum DSM 43021]
MGPGSIGVFLDLLGLAVHSAANPNRSRKTPHRTLSHPRSGEHSVWRRADGSVPGHFTHLSLRF